MEYIIILLKHAK